jgi:hypothetical protein
VGKSEGKTALGRPRSIRGSCDVKIRRSQPDMRIISAQYTRLYHNYEIMKYVTTSLKTV